MKYQEGGDSLPNEIVKVDVEYIEVGLDGSIIKTPLELWAGFIGLSQGVEDFALTPKIGWMIRKKDVDNIVLKHKLKYYRQCSMGIFIRVKEIPKELLEVSSIRSLTIDFVDKINIPDSMREIDIEELVLLGEVSKSEIERICKMFPKIYLVINGEHVGIHNITDASNK